MARFYELRTNRPLFFTRGYVLTYSDADVPTQYAFKVGSRLETIEREYEGLAAARPGASTAAEEAAAPGSSEALREGVRRVIAALDAQGRWVEEGRLRSQGEATRRILDSQIFIRHVEVLSRFLAAS